MKKRTTNKLADNKIAPRVTIPMADEEKTHAAHKKNLMVMLSVPKIIQIGSKKFSMPNTFREMD